VGCLGCRQGAGVGTEHPVGPVVKVHVWKVNRSFPRTHPTHIPLPPPPPPPVTHRLQVSWPQQAPALRLAGHSGEATAVAWCPSHFGQLASCGDDGTVRLWATPASDSRSTRAGGAAAAAGAAPSPLRPQLAEGLFAADRGDGCGRQRPGTPMEGGRGDSCGGGGGADRAPPVLPVDGACGDGPGAQGEGAGQSAVDGHARCITPATVASSPRSAARAPGPAPPSTGGAAAAAATSAGAAGASKGGGGSTPRYRQASAGSQGGGVRGVTCLAASRRMRGGPLGGGRGAATPHSSTSRPAARAHATTQVLLTQLSPVMWAGRGQPGASAARPHPSKQQQPQDQQAAAAAAAKAPQQPRRPLQLQPASHAGAAAAAGGAAAAAPEEAAAAEAAREAAATATAAGAAGAGMGAAGAGSGGRHAGRPAPLPLQGLPSPPDRQQPHFGQPSPRLALPSPSDSRQPPHQGQPSPRLALQTLSSPRPPLPPAMQLLHRASGLPGAAASTGKHLAIPCHDRSPPPPPCATRVALFYAHVLRHAAPSLFCLPCRRPVRCTQADAPPLHTTHACRGRQQRRPPGSFASGAAPAASGACSGCCGALCVVSRLAHR
jgi:hypothetical protein